MKTIKTYIAIFTFLFTYMGAFSQNVEGSINNSDYVANRSLDLQNNAENSLTKSDNHDNNENPVVFNRMLAADMINYQAVARDAAGNLIMNTAITVDFDIHENIAAGPIVYSETQNPTTDDNGVFSVQIGAVTPLAVDWSASPHFLEVSLNGTSVGTTEFVSVPYAKSADAMPEDATIGTNLDDADVLTISGTGSELVDIRSTVALAAANDLLNLEMAAGSPANAQFIEGRVDGALAFQVQGDGSMLIESTTTAPLAKTLYGNSMPIAYASVTSTGTISTAYGVTSITKGAAGVYDVVIDHPTNTANSIVTITPFSTIGIPEIGGYSPTGPNSFTVNIQTTAGVGRDTAFSFVVYGNH